MCVCVCVHTHTHKHTHKKHTHTQKHTQKHTHTIVCRSYALTDCSVDDSVFGVHGQERPPLCTHTHKHTQTHTNTLTHTHTRPLYTHTVCPCHQNIPKTISILKLTTIPLPNPFHGPHEDLPLPHGVGLTSTNPSP